jgi:histone acetyltransferase SAS3
MSKLIFYARFCKETEENDPSEEFEEYLACAVCGDNGEWPDGETAKSDLPVRRPKCG